MMWTGGPGPVVFLDRILLGRWQGLWELWETRERFPSRVGRRGLIAAFHTTAASIARSLLRHLAQQLFLVFAKQIHVQIPRSLDPVLVGLDGQRADQT